MVYSRGNLATENLLWEKGELIKKKKIVNTHTHTHTHTLLIQEGQRGRERAEVVTVVVAGTAGLGGYLRPSGNQTV